MEQLFGELARVHYVARTPAIDELNIAALRPAQGVKGPLENHDPRLSFWIIRDPHQHAHPPHAIRLLCASRERPGRSAAQKDHKFTPLHVEHGPCSRPGVTSTDRPTRPVCRTLSVPQSGRQVLGATLNCSESGGPCPRS